MVHNVIVNIISQQVEYFIHFSCQFSIFCTIPYIYSVKGFRQNSRKSVMKLDFFNCSHHKMKIYMIMNLDTKYLTIPSSFTYNMTE